MDVDAMLDRLSRRGTVTITTSTQLRRWTEGKTSYTEALAKPWAKVIYEPDAAHRKRYGQKTRIEEWMFGQFLGTGYQEVEAPTIAEALTVVLDKTEPARHYLDELVPYNEDWKRGVPIVMGLIRCAA